MRKQLIDVRQVNIIPGLDDTVHLAGYYWADDDDRSAIAIVEYTADATDEDLGRMIRGILNATRYVDSGADS